MGSNKGEDRGTMGGRKGEKTRLKFRSKNQLQIGGKGSIKRVKKDESSPCDRKQNGAPQDLAQMMQAASSGAKKERHK